MLIRKLETYAEYSKAVDLRIRYWNEELAGHGTTELSPEKELDFLVEWEQSAADYDDKRVLYGVFDEGVFAGFAGGSYAEVEDDENAFELNYLFVAKAYRGKGYSLQLMLKLIDDFLKSGKSKMVVYSHRHAPSNAFYRKYGGGVIREVIQGEDQLLVDVFVFDAEILKRRLKRSLEARDCAK